MPIGPYQKKQDAMIRLTPGQAESLNAIAAELQCTASGGPHVGKPSWRVMLVGIAEGHLRVYNPRAKRGERPARLDKKAAKSRFSVEGAPAWWSPWFGNAVGLDHALKKASREEILAFGLRFETNPLLSAKDVVVGKPEWPAPFVPTRPHWWWMPVNGRMRIADAEEISGLAVDTMIAGGMTIDGDFIRPHADWRGWVMGEPDEPMMETPAWFRPREDGRNLMPTADAVAASGMGNAAAMMKRGIRIIDGEFVTGPTGSAWAYDVEVES